MRCDLSRNPLKEDCQLNGGFTLSQESFTSELVEFEASSYLLHLFGAYIAFIEVKGGFLWGLILGLLLIAYT